MLVANRRKMAALIMQANSWHQMKETNSWNHLKKKKKTVSYWKKHTTKSQQSS